MINSKTLLIIGFVLPEPKSSAAGCRMMQLIELFQIYGYDINFVSTAQNLEFSEDLSKIGITIQKVNLNDSFFDSFVKDFNPDVVLFDRFMTEEQFGWRVSEQCPNALKILDTEDLHSLRLCRQEAVKNNVSFSKENLLTSEVAKREIASIFRCDLSLFVSEVEVELVKSLFNIPENLIYYLPIFADKVEIILDFDNSKDFVFIGNFLHEPNWDSVKYLKEKIWPTINKKLPSAKMLVYGAYASQKVLQLHNEKQNFIVMGRAENAEEVVKSAKVFLAPIRFGAGIKGKLLEAMQCGTPSITTSIGAEAMHGNLEWNGFIEDDVNLFAEKAVKVYEDESLWNSFQKNGFEILEKRYAKSDFVSDFIDKINFLLDNLEYHRRDNFIGSMLQHSFHSSTKYMSKWIEEKNKNR